MNKYAVLIGNSRFPDETDNNKLPDLACPEQDVEGLSKILASERGEFNVLPLKNKQSYEVLRELQRKVKTGRSRGFVTILLFGAWQAQQGGHFALDHVRYSYR